MNDDIIKLNNIKEDFYHEDDDIKNIYLKSRAKSLEYFINKTVFKKKYKTQQLPRIIHPLQKEYKKHKKHYINTNHYENELEIDGCFLVKDSFILEDCEFLFES